MKKLMMALVCVAVVLGIYPADRTVWGGDDVAGGMELKWSLAV